MTINKSTYDAIWTHTDKAIRYLQRRGCDFVVFAVEGEDDCGNILGYKVSGYSPDMMDHVHKTYPQALVEFTAQQDVTSEKQIREDAWNVFVGK